MKIALVAGELSSDLLGAGLIQALRSRYPQAQFYGIGGPRMQAAGCQILFPMEKLAVMGLVEVLKHLAEIIKIRRALAVHLLRDRPDVFIGIDAPDFNLNLERRLRKQGIKTVHYVSPSVWAWRQYRIRRIAKSVDRMLTLFPFEAKFYVKHAVDVRFVGHPLADMIPIDVQKEPARVLLQIEPSKRVVALLPGSRRSEVERLALPFIQAAHICAQKYRDLVFVVPLASQAIREMFRRILRDQKTDLPIVLVDGNSHQVMQAADFCLVASGTATLEALLIGRPMVVAYKLSPVTYWLLQKFRMLKIAHYSLPNILAGDQVVEELIQEQCNPENLAAALIRLIENPERVRELHEIFSEIYKQLKKNANEQAASAVAELLEGSYARHATRS